MKKSLIISTQQSFSLNKISRAIETHLSHTYTIKTKDSPKWWRSDIFIQHYVSKLTSYMRHNKKFLIQPIDGTTLAENTILQINEYDEIFTPSKLNKHYLRLNGITKPIHVVPNFYDSFEPDNTYFSTLTKESKYTFYTETTGIRRKNVLNLVKYFIEEFDSNTNVRLVIKINNDKLDELNDLIKSYSHTPEMIIIAEYLNDRDMQSLMLNSDCYICLSHMEGFCIPLLNAAVLEKDIIALDTKISGYSDFINKSNAYLVPSKLIPIDTQFESMLIYTPDSLWEEPDYTEYKKALRQVFNKTYQFDKTQNYSKYSLTDVMDRYKTILSYSDVKKMDFNFGVFHLPEDAGCNHLVRHNYNDWENWWPQILQENVKPDSNILDIGAHIGFTSIRFSEYLPSGHIFAFEPSKISYKYLQDNLSINGIKNVTALQYAVGDEVKLVSLTNNTNLFTNKVSESLDSLDTQLVTIDSLSLPKIDFMKIDTEGYEINVLKGALNLIKRDKPTIVIEIFDKTYPETESYLKDLGYSSFTKIPGENSDYLVK